MSEDLNRQIFKEEAYDLLGELESTLLELEDEPDNLDTINRVFRALHTIKGSGSMFGFDAIADFTHKVETVFDMVRNGELAVTKELINLAFMSRDFIKNLLDNSDDDESFQTEGADTIIAGLNNLAVGQGAAQTKPGDDGSDEEPEADSATDEAPRILTTYQVSVTPKVETLPEGFSLQPIIDELNKLGPCQVSEKGPDCREGAEAGVPVCWDITIETDADEENIKDVFFFSDVDMVVKVEKFRPSIPRKEDVEDQEIEEYPKIGEILVEEGVVGEQDIDEALAQQKPLGQILKESGKVSVDQVESAAERQRQARERRATNRQQEAMTSLRVAADKLDKLVDLVGELVIVQAQISQVVATRKDADLTVLVEDLERLSDELRDSTLGIRMLPIGTTFSKFRRLVRDLSSELGKEIVLVTEGADTEMDKTVIERLGDPLVHLLRNSIDHGIELPEERKAAGKKPEGTITLAAEHSGGEVLIRITDDGKGMDAEALRMKAVERGLISPESEIPEKEIYTLIFEAGFSTAKQVTSVSGRGVGMDVVKRAIDSLRGRIEIESEPDKGTSIIIRLPLTLAIIDGLQVKVADEYFVIPLSLVEECVELNRDEVDDSERQRILHLRGEIVPYIMLREWFQLNGEPPSIEQIVVTGVAGNRIGIVVDHVVGEHQTVIKSLSKVYKDVEGISGATIKGDGSIALILDIPRLVRRVAVETG